MNSRGEELIKKLEQFFGKLAARDWPPDTDPATFTKITQIFEQEIAF
ncbi:MAG: hypothetical protein ACE5R6_20360 [Candidatus Heimdallarchaeota archaeon]